MDSEIQLINGKSKVTWLSSGGCNSGAILLATLLLSCASG
jgi:hypothetical protein